jgi:hypothetical protein
MPRLMQSIRISQEATNQEGRSNKSEDAATSLRLVQESRSIFCCLEICNSSLVLRLVKLQL